MITSESKGRFFLLNESIRIDSHNESNRLESIRIANWNALYSTDRVRAVVRLQQQQYIRITATEEKKSTGFMYTHAAYWDASSTHPATDTTQAR